MSKTYRSIHYFKLALQSMFRSISLAISITAASTEPYFTRDRKKHRHVETRVLPETSEMTAEDMMQHQLTLRLSTAGVY